MTAVSRTFSLLTCAACCALVGCCLVPKSRAACGDCTSSAIAEVPSTYENYTPPQPSLRSVPQPGVVLPPEPDGATVPPPPTTRVVPDSRFDFFEPANNDRAGTNTR